MGCTFETVADLVDQRLVHGSVFWLGGGSEAIQMLYSAVVQRTTLLPLLPLYIEFTSMNQYSWHYFMVHLYSTSSYSSLIYCKLIQRVSNKWKSGMTRMARVTYMRAPRPGFCNPITKLYYYGAHPAPFFEGYFCRPVASNYCN